MSDQFSPFTRTDLANFYPILFNDGFTQANFLDGLQLIAANNQVGPANSSLANPYGEILSQDFFNFGSTTAIARLFDSYLRNMLITAQPLKNNNLDTFIQGWYTYAQNAGLTLKYIDTLTNSSHSALYQGLLQEYLYVTNGTVDANNHYSGGDLAPIFANQNGTQSGLSPDFSSMQSPTNPLVQLFNNFLHSAPQLFDSPPYTYMGQSLFQAFDAYITTTAVIQDPLHPLTPLPQTTLFQNLPSYASIYQTYIGPIGPQFIENLIQFAQDQITKNGYFLPSQSLGDWIQRVVKQSENGIPVLKGGSLDGNNSEKALIIDRILRLLIQIISSLQNVGIMQANRLRYLTQFQQAYTTLQTQIPTFLRGGPVLGGTDDQSSRDRNDLNSTFNGILADKLRSLRGVQEDNAKTLQSNINQTNDAVNQQTDMANSFLQELSTLLGSILR
jgi:hypothetical protein